MQYPFKKTGSSSDVLTMLRHVKSDLFRGFIRSDANDDVGHPKQHQTHWLTVNQHVTYADGLRGDTADGARKGLKHISLPIWTPGSVGFGALRYQLFAVGPYEHKACQTNIWWRTDTRKRLRRG